MSPDTAKHLSPIEIQKFRNCPILGKKNKKTLFDKSQIVFPQQNTNPSLYLRTFAKINKTKPVSRKTAEEEKYYFVIFVEFHFKVL